MIAIIPARGGSKGIKNKNILKIAGKPLIVWSIEHALQSKSVKKVFVTTDNDEIAEISKKTGANVIKRPLKLANDTASSEDAIKHALDVVEYDLHIVPANICFLQATSPVREAYDIDRAFKVYQEQELDSLFSCCKVEDRFVWEKQANRYKSISYDYKDRKRRQDVTPKFLENGSIYIFKYNILRLDNNRLGGKIGVYEMPMWRSFQVDKPEDIEISEYYLKKLSLK